MRQGITRFSPNELFIGVALGWVFSSFLQGIAGFGTPIAIIAGPRLRWRHSFSEGGRPMTMNIAGDGFRKRTLAITASILILVGLALVVTGLANERPVVWGVGLIAVAIAMAMSLATRWVGSGPE